MKKSVKAPAGPGTMFHKAAIAALVAGATGMFAVGVLTKQNSAPTVAGADAAVGASAAVAATDVPLAKTEVRFTRPGAGEAALNYDALAKPLDVTVTQSTGKLWDLFRDIGYEIDGVRIHGEVPRLFLASLPQDLRHQPRAELRKTTFIKSTLPLILHVNELILQDRERLKSLRDQAADGRVPSEQDRLWLEEMADLYGAKSAEPADLLTRVDIVPPSLAIAQAAEESGWGTSRFAREGNALFGQRAYKAHKKGIVPKKRPDGTSFRVRAFDHLIDGVKSYVHNLNSHSAYREFRKARAKMRAEQGDINGYGLAGALTRYSERGADYIKTIRVIMRANTLRAFDDAKLGRSVSPDA
ncbi:MAG: Bax protein [Paracoccaceae bacterium]|jgi:Bax protein